MTEKTYWLVNEAGTKAFAADRAERDRWVPLGWSETTEPTGAEFLYARMDGIADPGRFPAAAFRETWAPRGWAPCAPPEPVSPFTADHVAASASAVQTSKPVTTSAAGGSTKEK